MHQVINLLSSSDFSFLRSILTRQVRRKVPSLVDLSLYHQLASDEVHQGLASKRERVLCDEDSAQLLALSSIQDLLINYPDYRISNVVYDSENQEERPEFYFRLVRPNKESDVGTPHCDFWFDEATQTNYGRGNTLKLWIPIVIEPGKNGLLFYPHAPNEVPYTIANENGYLRPLINFDLAKLGDPLLPTLSYGQALMFCDDILHCGAPNIGSTTRVSMEITLVKVR
jgi:hypothetical protein